MASRAKTSDVRSTLRRRMSGYWCLQNGARGTGARESTRPGRSSETINTYRGTNMSITAIKTAVTRQAADWPALEALQRDFNGQIVLPNDDAYDAARTIWNAMIDKRPALIVR